MARFDDERRTSLLARLNRFFLLDRHVGVVFVTRHVVEPLGGDHAVGDVRDVEISGADREVDRLLAGERNRGRRVFLAGFWLFNRTLFNGALIEGL